MNELKNTYQQLKAKAKNMMKNGNIVGYIRTLQEASQVEVLMIKIAANQ